jgi:hypothetical protein
VRRVSKGHKVQRAQRVLLVRRALRDQPGQRGQRVLRVRKVLKVSKDPRALSVRPSEVNGLPPTPTSGMTSSHTVAKPGSQ